MIEQYFSVVMFITLYKAILTFNSVDEIHVTLPFKLKLLSSSFCGAVYISVFTN